MLIRESRPRRKATPYLRKTCSTCIGGRIRHNRSAISRNRHSTGIFMRAIKGRRSSSRSGSAANSRHLIRPHMMSFWRTDTQRTFISTPRQMRTIFSNSAQLLRMMSTFEALSAPILTSRTKKTRISTRMAKSRTPMGPTMPSSTTQNSWPSSPVELFEEGWSTTITMRSSCKIDRLW